MIYMEPNGSSSEEKNVLGEPLEPCSKDPMTGFKRDGHCRDVEGDQGKHQLCAEMTEAFLSFTRKRGNDLQTPQPAFDFPGLEPGDCWCLCVPRWLEAYEAGVAPPVHLEATSQSVLDDVSLEVLREHAVNQN